MWVSLMLRKLKKKYWSYHSIRSLKASLSLAENCEFAEHIKSEKKYVLDLAARGIPDQIEERLDAAINWLLRAQKATGDDGVSLGYFPLSVQNGWRPSYPETTGYIITSLLKYAQEFEREDIAQAACFLVSQQASFISGQILNVNGGQR